MNEFSSGLGESLLRRVGERPWRWFCSLWLVFFLASLLYAALHVDRMQFIGQPPPAAGIPYHQFLPGGSRESEIGEFRIDPDAIPAYDPSLVNPQMGYLFRPLPPNSGSVRLHGTTPILSLWLGSFGISASRAWDVSNPADITRPGIGTWPTGPQLHWHPGTVSVAWGYEDGARAVGLGLTLPGALIHLALPQLAAAFTVVPLATFFRIRRRRRARRVRCLECGHACDAQRQVDRCPECGCAPASPASELERKQPRLVGSPGRITTWIFSIAGVAWLVVQLAVVHSEHYSLDEKRQLLVQFADETGRSLTRPIYTMGRSRGWPVYLLHVQHDEWFSFSPDAEPQRTSHQRPGFAWHGNYFSWVREQGDPSVTRLYTLYWAQIALQLAVLHAIATILAIALWAACTALASRAWRVR